MSAGGMAMQDRATLIARLDSYPAYRTEFGEVFRGNAPISMDSIAASLASYLRTLVTPNSPYDRYLDGEETALSPSAARGFHRFVETGCASCHFWVNMAGPVPGLAFGMGEGFYELFPNFVGSTYDARYHLMDDMGRYVVTHDEAHRHLWRVASLRNIALTAPYFHNGSVATLAEAVRVMARTELNQELGAAEVDDIVSFLHSLTGDHPKQTAPQLP
jgi:cytochrome c peroxidase